jgi:hypothetical protein
MDEKKAYQMGVDRALQEAGIAELPAQPEQEKTAEAQGDEVPEIVKLAYQEGAAAALRKHLEK